MNRLFSLDKRLAVCADMVEKKSGFIDVGTDHAYLPIWLVKTGKINNAVAVDINSRPLEKAKQNILKYNVEDKVQICLSNGLEKINEKQADTVVIAGMGADTIIMIIKSTPWLKNNKTLILQSMTANEKLRRFLKKEGFKIKKEKAVISCGKCYSVIKTDFKGTDFQTDKLYPYIGLICRNIPKAYEDVKAVLIYIGKEIKNLNNQLSGLKKNQKSEEVYRVQNIICRLEEERKKYSEYSFRNL